MTGIPYGYRQQKPVGVSELGEEMDSEDGGTLTVSCRR